MAQWLRRAGRESWDLGSNPRSPIISMLFCLMCSRAGHQRRPTMHLMSQPAMWLQAVIQRLGMDDHHIPWSKHAQIISQVKHAYALMGQQFPDAPPPGPNTPWFIHFFFFFLFSFFLLICFY